MPNPSTKKIVCITGLPGAGKSTVAKVASELGFEVVNMGDVIREEAEKRNIRKDEASLGRIMLELREKKGAGVVAELCLPKIKSSKRDRFVIDGVRSLDEVNIFRKAGKTKVLAISTPRSLRKHFLINRKRDDDPVSENSFERRDAREMGVGVTDVIAIADETIENSGITLSELRVRAEKAVRALG